jgi:hypothetical protein
MCTTGKVHLVKMFIERISFIFIKLFECNNKVSYINMLTQSAENYSNAGRYRTDHHKVCRSNSGSIQPGFIKVMHIDSFNGRF